MSRTDARKANWLFFSFISYYWQRCSSNSSRVHSLTKRCFSTSLFFAFSTLSHLPPPRPGSCSEMLSLKLLLTWFERYYYPFIYLARWKVYKCIYLWAWGKEDLVPTSTLRLGEFIKSYRKDASPKYFLSSGSKMLFQPNPGRAEGKKDIPWENESFEFKGMSCYLMWSIHMKVKWNPHRNKRLTWVCLQGSC